MRLRQRYRSVHTCWYRKLVCWELHQRAYLYERTMARYGQGENGYHSQITAQERYKNLEAQALPIMPSAGGQAKNRRVVVTFLMFELFAPHQTPPSHRRHSQVRPLSNDTHHSRPPPPTTELPADSRAPRRAAVMLLLDYQNVLIESLLKDRFSGCD